MTHQRLREKAEVSKDWMGTDWFDDDWSVLRPFDFECSDFIKECTPETILSLLAELDAARKDAERWKAVRDNRGPGLRLITWAPNECEELQVMFPSQKLCDEYADSTIDAALNADGEKGDD